MLVYRNEPEIAFPAGLLDMRSKVPNALPSIVLTAGKILLILILSQKRAKIRESALGHGREDNAVNGKTNRIDCPVFIGDSH